MPILTDILDAWRSHNVVGQLFELFARMLSLCYDEYVIAMAVWRGELGEREGHDQIRRKDKQVNQFQLDIRSRLVRHLTVNPGDSVPASLVFMSIAKDAERLGDYAKNLAEVYRHPGDTGEPAAVAGAVNALLETCRSDFERTRQAFTENDTRLAEEVIGRTKQVRRGCDELLEKLLAGVEGVEPQQAVAFALAGRYCKRVSAHLKNICTAVVAPVEFLDYSKKGIAARGER